MRYAFISVSRDRRIVDFKSNRRVMEGLEISELRVEPCVDSRYIKPSRVVFKQVSHSSLFSTTLKDLCNTRHS